ncbi:MAG: trypsin-like serine protease [Byssovorax sp.]
MNRSALLVVLPLMLPGCFSPTPDPGFEPVDEAASPIIGGMADPGDPAVMLLVSYPADESTLDTCSAALISPTVLVTAAHCVDAATHPGHTFGIYAQPDATVYSTIAKLKPKLLAVKSVHIPVAYDPAPPFRADIGVVVLAQPVDVTPLPINRATLKPELVGTPARIVGYGQTTPGKYNVKKYAATTVVQSIGPEDTVIVGDAMHRSCVGDSGGPALVKIDGVETLLGVDSYTETSGCIEPANYRRMDVFTTFLDTYAPPPPPPNDGGMGGSGGGGAGGGSSTTGTGASTAASGGPEPASSGGCDVHGDPRGDLGTSAAAMLAATALWRRRRAAKRARSARAI